MGIKYYTIQIRGKTTEWSIPLGSVPKAAIKDWKADGSDIAEVHNNILHVGRLILLRESF